MRSWERKSARVALIAGAMLFAFYHLRLQGMFGLLPVAFLLTYLVLRSNSLVSGILAHFANNALAALYAILAIQQPDLKLPFPSLPAAGVGLVVLIGGVWLLRRITPAPEKFEPGRGAGGAESQRIFAHRTLHPHLDAVDPGCWYISSGGWLRIYRRASPRAAGPG